MRMPSIVSKRSTRGLSPALFCLAAMAFAVRATLRYRSAPQDVLDALFGKGELTVETVDMTAAETTLGDR